MTTPKLTRHRWEKFARLYQPIVSHPKAEEGTDPRYQWIAPGEMSKANAAAEKAGGESHLWTVLEVDGRFYAVPGRYWVNRWAWIITAKPWPHENMEIIL